MLFLEYPSCSTCRRAKKWLDDNQLAYTDRHIVKERPSYEELKDWYERSALALKKFFNSSGVLYREMQLKDKLGQMTEEEQLKLLASEGKLVKRPLIIADDFVLVGFKEEEWKAALKK